MSNLNNIEPKAVWNYFEEISKIPRPSKKEEKIRQYLLNFGKEHNLNTKTDAVGNVLISKPATKGMENRKSVILQSHIDMVCEKNRDTVHDFDNDPIIPKIDGAWVRANGTTLGADDGIGVAAQLAILTDKNIKHPELECLFTVDEETGMSGAHGLQEGFMKGEILINLDSEDEGELFIGCAGGMDTVGSFAYSTLDAKGTIFHLSVQNLNGGHSGDKIDKGLGNSIKVANRFLWIAMRKYGIGLIKFEGGNKRNAIPREAFASFVVHSEKEEKLLDLFENFKQDAKLMLKATEPAMTIQLEKEASNKITKIIDRSVTEKLLNSLYACPHGVIAMSHDLPGLVETSTNLASIKFTDKFIVIETSQRSSVEAAKRDIASMVESVFMMGGAMIEHGKGYPGWKPNTNSEILIATETSYEELFGKKPIVRAIHAGLECGLFLDKYPHLDMISFGPTIKGAHSPDERLHIPTVKKFWDYLLLVLERIPE